MIKEKWKLLLLVFAAAFLICLGAIIFMEKKDQNAGTEKIEVGQVIWFDISTYNNMGESVASVYDYVTAWSDEVLMSDCVDRFDNAGFMNEIVPEWENKGIDSKITWITNNITVKRISSSTMYRISYDVEVNSQTKDATLNEVNQMIETFIDYAVSVAKLSDKDIQYDSVDQIYVEKPAMEGDVKAVDVILRVAIAGVLSVLITLTFLGFLIIKNKKESGTESN